MTSSKLQRNDPCSCGSGKKYKHCCMATAEASSAMANSAPGLSIRGAIDAAIAHHRAGRLVEAEQLYRQVLAEQPNHPDALHLLGAIAHKNGDHGRAMELILQAIAIKPSAAMYGNLGLAAKAVGDLDAAVDCFRKALELDPKHVNSHNNLGVVLKEQGKHDQAMECFLDALKLKPDYADAYCNLGSVAHDLGRMEEAIECFQNALSFAPDYAIAHFNLGNALRDLGQVDEAIRSFEKSIALAPSYAMGYNNLANVYKSQGKHEQAAELLKKALSLAPDSADVHSNLGLTLHALGDFDGATECFRKTLALDPKHFHALNNLGFALKEQGKPAEAIEYFLQALAIKPDFADAYCNMGYAAHELGRLEEAVACFHKALSLEPDMAAAYNNLGNTLKDLGRPEEAIEAYKKVLSLEPEKNYVYSNMLLTMLSLPHYMPGELYEEHLKFAQQYEAPLKPFWPKHANLRDKNKRLKIGYVSGDFYNHSLAYFFEPILAAHDKTQVEVYCYYNNHKNDQITQKIAALCDHWLPCKGFSHEALAQRIQDDGIDILIDLSGHTALNRLMTFARKPAPIQISWIGYPATTGLSAMDYRLTDVVIDPEGMAEQYHSEALLRLQTSVRFKPSEIRPPINALPALTRSTFTFACLNNLVKITEEAIAVWAQILLALPGARLMLGNVNDQSTRKRFVDAFAAHGVTENQLVTINKLPLADYLALHHQIDLALDPFPYNGGTTSYHSLSMGVPVITLAGTTPVSRCGAYIMMDAGLPEFVAESRDDYLKIAISFAKDPPRLEQIRQSLRTGFDWSASQADTARELERIFRQVWEKWCDEK